MQNVLQGIKIDARRLIEVLTFTLSLLWRGPYKIIFYIEILKENE